MEFQKAFRVLLILALALSMLLVGYQLLSVPDNKEAQIHLLSSSQTSTEPLSSSSREEYGEGLEQEEETSFPLDLNLASGEQLQQVPGIGPVLSGRIIEYRETHGGFQSLEELLNIQGIGEKTLEKIRPYFVINS